MTAEVVSLDAGAEVTAGPLTGESLDGDLALQLVGVSKRYGDVIGIDEVDLSVPRGEVFGFIGPNGAGKTTTMRLVLDLIRPTAGTISVLGVNLADRDPSVRGRIGYLPAELALVDGLTVDGFFEWMASLRCAERRLSAGSRFGRRRVDRDGTNGADRARQQLDRARSLSDRLDLDRRRRIGDLSSGNRRKVGLVQALMHSPDLAVLDEPTAGIDPIMQLEFRRLVRELAENGTTVFLSSHVLHEVEDVCDRVATIVDGRLRGVLCLEEFRRRPQRHVVVVVQGERPASPAGRRGVSGASVARQDHDSWLVEFDVTGPMDDVAAWIGEHCVIDLSSEPVTLEQRFVDEVGGDAVDEVGGDAVGRGSKGSSRPDREVVR